MFTAAAYALRRGPISSSKIDGLEETWPPLPLLFAGPGPDGGGGDDGGSLPQPEPSPGGPSGPPA